MPSDWWITLAFLGAAVMGMLVGLRVANRFSSESLRHGFAWCGIALGLALLAKNSL